MQEVSGNIVNNIIMILSFRLKAFLASAGFLLAISYQTGAQVVVERSKDKVIISGTPYYIHFVKKGETAYSISKAYNITIEELNRENPPAVYGLKEGQSLRLPVREDNAKPPEQAVPRQRRDEARYIYHRLEPGQTVYSISKLYGVSEEEIVEANPGIDIKRLPVNAEIAVPRREFMTEKQEFAVQDSKYIFHKVERGESLASIADKYGITLRELRRENRDTRFPQVGDYIRIPVSRLPEPSQEIEKPVTDTLEVAPGDSVVMWPRPAGYTPVRDLKGSYDVAVLLPFYIDKNADRIEIDSSKIVKGKRIYKPAKRPEEWIYTRSMGFVEMYQGILLAADTLCSQGLNINIYTFDIQGDTLELSRMINRGELEGMELIIGPVYSNNLAIVTAYAGKLGIPVVSPVRLMNNLALVNNPLLFMANASLEVAQNKIAKKVSEYYDDNFVFIHTDTAGTDQDVIRFREKIMAELSSRIPYEEIKFKEFLFYSRSAFNNDSINRLGHALTASTGNVIIIASEEDPVISETLQEVHSLSKKYPVRVFGYPSLRGLDNLEPKFIFELDLLIFSPSWIDYTKRDVVKFNDDFRRKFLTEPSESSYAWIGYDITYYFLSGLAIHGRDFIEHPEIHNPDLLQTEFDFRRTSIYDGFENQKLFPVKYTIDYEVRLTPGENPEQ